MNICVFVCNKKYFGKFINTCSELITNGKYKGLICLVIGDDLNNHKLLNHDIIKNNNIIVKYFPDIQFPNDFYFINNNINSDGRNITKKFQWHKLHLFNIYFKQWDGVFYIDCGMKILDDISPFLDIITENTLLAHSDAYPLYKWKLHGQFDKKNSEYFNRLNNNYDLNSDYFQSGILLYDTQIIENVTYNNLLKLAIDYPISRTNEQGIMNLYFNCDKNIWKQLKLRNEHTNLYDYWCRDKKDTKYIIVKNKNW
tara:strand:+ start:129 stop:893 length:765 start_codon:yes stop_codon:yes gene_type:complete